MILSIILAAACGGLAWRLHGVRRRLAKAQDTIAFQESEMQRVRLRLDSEARIRAALQANLNAIREPHRQPHVSGWA